MARDFQDSNSLSLRNRAEARLVGRSSTAPRSEPDAQRTIYELQVHQVELQMQNEELRRVQTELELARVRYFDLFDNAPIAYLTLNEGRAIADVNLAAAQIIGEAQAMLTTQPIANYVHLPDRELFLHCVKLVFSSGDPQACDVRMLTKKGTAFAAHVEMSALLNDFNERMLRVMVISRGKT